jgi:hypothetical protein
MRLRPAYSCRRLFYPATNYLALRRHSGLEGERKLMFAVLEDGVRCYLKNMETRSRRRRNLFFEVRDWKEAEDNDGPFYSNGFASGVADFC